MAGGRRHGCGGHGRATGAGRPPEAAAGHAPMAGGRRIGRGGHSGATGAAAPEALSASTCQVLLILFSPGGGFFGMFCATNSDRKTPGKPLRRRGALAVGKTPGQFLLFAGIPPSGPPSSSKNVYISKFVAQIGGFRKPDANPSFHTAGRPAPRTALVEEACEQRRSQRRPWHAGWGRADAVGCFAFWLSGKSLMGSGIVR